MTTESDADFRARLRDFLETNHPGPRPRDAAERKEWQRRWAETLYDKGFAGPGWPREWGGMALPFPQQVIYQEEVARARVPGPLGTGLNIIGPTIIRFGTPEQKERWLRPMLRGERVWVQGFSEPEAGSDLPSLRTTAQRVGEEYVVNGQKVWTSALDEGDMLFCLVRTGTQESRHHGISYLMVDLATPGVTARPLRDMTGDAFFGEVFFSDARVPVANRLGEENGAWPLVRTSLGHERAAGAMNQSAMYRRVLDELTDLARRYDLAGQQQVRQGLADFEIRLRVMRSSAMRIISDITTKGEPGPISSASRLFVATFEQDLHEFAVDTFGMYGVLDRDDEAAIQRSRWTIGFLRTRASTIGTGTSQIQRNTIAERVLGLPPEPAASAP